MSKRKHIPDDKLPPKPKAWSRIVLPAQKEFTKECLRLARDRADRALQEIIRLRIHIPLLDQKIVLYSDNENGLNSSRHKITLAELNTLLTELVCILEQAYSVKKSLKGEKQDFNHIKHRTSRRGIKDTCQRSISFPFNDLDDLPRHPRLTKIEPAAQLIRRNELLEVEKG